MAGSPTVTDADPLVDEGQPPADIAQPDKPIVELTDELADLPGVVDEEPLDHNDRDERRGIRHRRDTELTEDFFANDFVTRHGESIRFDHTTCRWYVWNSFFWAKDETNRVFDKARRFSRELRGDDKRMASKKAIEGMEIMARRDPRVTVTSDAWDPNPFILGTPDGYVDLRTGKLMPPEPLLMVSKVTSVAPAQKGAACPHFDKFIDQVTLGDAGVKRFLQQYLGYCLTGVTSEQVLLFVYGPGGNGKSQLQKVVAEIMGDYAKTAAMDTFTASRHQRHLTEIAMLDGARFVSVSEIEKGQKSSQARINQLTGGDPVTANYMRQDHFTYIPEFKLMVLGNHSRSSGRSTRRPGGAS